MPTDEQRMREQFEKWIDEKQYGLGWQDGRGTWEEFLSATWAGYKAGQLARDAEVQALRKALAELHADVCHLFGVSEPLPDGGLVAAIALTRLEEVGLGHADRLGRGLNAARTALAGQGENHD